MPKLKNPGNPFVGVGQKSVKKACLSVWHLTKGPLTKILHAYRRLHNYSKDDLGLYLMGHNFKPLPCVIGQDVLKLISLYDK